MKYLDQQEVMSSNEAVEHSMSHQNQSHVEPRMTEASEPQSARTSDNSVVDAFEYEPNGYMSKGRW